MSLAPLVPREGIWTTASDSRSFELGQFQLLADSRQFGRLFSVDLGRNAFDGTGKPPTFSRVEFNFVTMRAMPTGDLGHQCCVTFVFIRYILDGMPQNSLFAVQAFTGHLISP